MYCNGTHGQSIGSLGQYAGETVYIEDVLIENVWMLNGDFSGRIKVWAGENTGQGWVRNVTYRNIWSGRIDYASAPQTLPSHFAYRPANSTPPPTRQAAFLDSCYFNIPADKCNKFPSKMNVTDVTFENFSGYTSGRYGNAVARLTCSTSESAVCKNITFKNFNVTTPCGGKPVVICDGVKGLGQDCVPFNSDEARAALAAKCSIGPVTIAPPWPVRQW